MSNNVIKIAFPHPRATRFSTTTPHITRTHAHTHIHSFGGDLPEFYGQLFELLQHRLVLGQQRSILLLPVTQIASGRSADASTLQHNIQNKKRNEHIHTVSILYFVVRTNEVKKNRVRLICCAKPIDSRLEVCRGCRRHRMCHMCHSRERGSAVPRCQISVCERNVA